MSGRNRSRSHLLVPLVLLLVLMLFGCDRFSLLDQFEFVGRSGTDSLALSLGVNTLRPGESCPLYPARGTPPYSYAAIASDLYSAGNPVDPGAIETDSDPARYTAGESIGKVTIRLSDSAGGQADAVVTILPWEPRSLSADGSFGGPQAVSLSWEYDFPGHIEGFRLERLKEEETNFTDITSTVDIIESSIDPDTKSYECIDSSASPQNNTYRLYAAAGQYRSAYSQASGKGNP